MKELGIDISAHRSRDISSLDLTEFNIVVAMTTSIAEQLRKAGVEGTRIKQMEVSDPYHRGIDVYRSTANEIEKQLRCLFGEPGGGLSLK
jgi:protein-tyrosine-phosphatase